MMNLFLVMAGGALGSGLRYGISLALPTLTSSFPTATILVNIVGTFILGLVAGTTGTSLDMNPATRLLLGTGLCGGFTTYSAFAFETALLLEQGNLLLAGTYVVATLVACGLAAWAGMALSRAISCSTC
jgi:CrcB protein